MFKLNLMQDKGLEIINFVYCFDLPARNGSQAYYQMAVLSYVRKF